MDTDYWKRSPFGEESIFHPSWEEKREQERQILLSTGKITNVLVTKGNGKYVNSYPRQDNLSPERYISESSRQRTHSVYIKVSVIVEGRAEAIYIAVNNQFKRAIGCEQTFEIKVPATSSKETINVKVHLTDFMGKEEYDKKEYDVTIDSSGNVIEKKEVEVRKTVKNHNPSAEFYSVLKEFEGLGYNIIYSGKDIVKVLPYDDGGEMGKGNATIGYGHLIDTKPFDASDSNHKKWIEGISLEDADALLVKDVKEKIPLLERLIKVELLQREYDALLLCLFNGGMGDTLITTINKGVENLTAEDVFKAFLVRRYIKGIESDGLIYRRAREAEIFIYENYHLYPSEKFKDRKAVIKAFKDFLKTGILPVLIVLITILLPSCQSSSEKHNLLKRTQSETCVIDSINEELHIDPNPDTYRHKYLYDKQYAYRYRHYGFTSEYQYNEILFDSNDSLLMQMDTVLEYSTPSHYYNVSLKKENVTVSVWRWKEMTDDTKIPIVMHGYQKDGFIYIEGEKGEHELCYKIVLGKCLFIWTPYNRLWFVINEGNI